MIYPLPNRKTEYLDHEKMTVEVRAITIGKMLKYLRTEINATQREIADRIGVAQQTYAGYEKGKHEPSIELMIRLADVYTVTMDFITGRNITEEQMAEEYEWIGYALPQIQREFESEREFTRMIIEQCNLTKK